MALDSYALETIQELLRDALTRSSRRHQLWNGLEQLQRSGESGPIGAGDIPQVVRDRYPDVSTASINLILPKVEMLMSVAMGRDPGFVVEPYSGGSSAVVGARIAKELLKYYWKRLRGTPMLRDMVRDAVVLGSGFCKIGWRYESEERERSQQEIERDLVDLVETERRTAILEGREQRGAKELLSLVDMRNNEIVADEPFLEYVSPYDIFVPPTARRLEESRWVAQRVRMPFDEAAENPAFSNTDTLQPSDRHDYAHLRHDDEQMESRPMRDESGGSEDDPFAEVTVWEFYDMRTRTLTVCQLHADEALYRDELPYSHRHTPYVHLRNHEDGGSRFWPFGDLENIAAIQSDFNDFIFEQLSNAQRSGNKYLIDESSFTPQLKELLESPQSDVAAAIKLKGEGSLQDKVQQFQRAPTNPEVFQASGDLRALMDQVLGLNVFQSGGGGPDRMSATAAAVVDGTASQRSQTKQSQVEDAAEDIGLKILLLSQEFLDRRQALRIAGTGGDAQWLNVSKEDLVGEFGVNVEAGSTRGTNPQTRQRRAVEMITSIVPTLAELQYDVDPMLRLALRDYGLDPDQVLQGGPQAAQQPMPGQPVPGQQGGPPPSQAAAGMSPAGTANAPAAPGAGPPQGAAPGQAMDVQRQGRGAV